MFALSLAAAAGCRPSSEDVLAAEKAHYQPVVVALQAHFARYHAYPADLDALVAQGLLATLPATRPSDDTDDDRRLSYAVSDDRLSCAVRFSYFLKRQALLGDTTYAEWRSGDGRWRVDGPGASAKDRRVPGVPHNQPLQRTGDASG